MRAKVVLFARVKDSTKPSGYRFENVNIKRGRPVAPADATTYYLRYQCNGKRVVKPAGNDLEVAFVAYENHERNLPALQRGESTPLLQDFQENAAGITLREAAENYVSGLQGKAASTVIAYRFAVKEFVRFAGEGTRISVVDRNTLLRYRDWLYKQEMNETTRHSRLLKTVIFLKSFGVEKLLRKTDWPKINERVPQSYSQDEITRLFAACNLEERLLFEFFLCSGARNAEVQHVVKGDIRISQLNGLNNGGSEVAALTIREKPSMDWRTKSKRDRVVRLPLEFTKRLLAARRESSDGDLLFPNAEGRPNCHFDVILRRVSQRAGVSGRVDLHKFRSTCATRLHSAGMPVQDVQKILGHRDIKTTLRYLSSTSHESEATGRAVEAAFSS